MTTSDSASTDPREQWAVTVTVPGGLTVRARADLYGYIADAAHGWEEGCRTGFYGPLPGGWAAKVSAPRVAADLGDAGEGK